MSKPPRLSEPCRQFGALPFRITPENGVEFLLVTSRETRQWIFPKGNPMIRRQKPLPPRQVVLLESLQEAGIIGTVIGKKLGTLAYNKSAAAPQATTPCRISIFALRVSETRDKWKESGQRKREWVTVEEAASRLAANTHFPDAEIIHDFLRNAATTIRIAANQPEIGKQPKKPKKAAKKRATVNRSAQQ